LTFYGASRSTIWDVRGRKPSLWRRLSAPQLFVGSFLGLVALGTIGLLTLPGLYTGPGLGFVDAVFTATSAVCVTGLIVVDTATYFTTRGQAFLLLLIQLGGLGIITFTTLIIVLLGRRLSLRQEAISSSSVEAAAPHLEVGLLTRDIVRFTVTIELLGAIALYLFWVPRFGWTEAVWPAFFHSVSAFCNAGFSTFSDSLMGFQRSPMTLGIVMGLISLGGIGFLTLEELHQARNARLEKRGYRLSLHSRLALATSGILILSGWVIFTVVEWRVSLADLPISARLVNGLFLSVTPRTAGFNSIDYALASDSTNFLTTIFMMIGGSPGSTAGGLKTTTVALIGLLAWSRFRGREVVSFWGRSVPEETIQRAVGLFVVGFGVVTVAILLFTATEIGVVGPSASGERFLSFMFEAASAFNTVGLSMNTTTSLSTGGRWLAILLMFVGRVGPLTFAAALAVRSRGEGARFRYAYEDVVVG
jgi:trk system potassium uptake protein TrkH